MVKYRNLQILLREYLPVVVSGDGRCVAERDVREEVHLRYRSIQQKEDLKALCDVVPFLVDLDHLDAQSNGHLDSKSVRNYQNINTLS